MIKPSREDRIHLLNLADAASAFDTTEMDVYSKDNFLQNLTKLQALAGQIDKAISTADLISLRASRWSSLGWVAKEVAKNGDINFGLLIARGISECSYRSDALSAIAKTIYSVDLDQACRVAATIENPENKWETFQAFCIWENASGKCQSAAAIACGIRFPSYRARAVLAAASGCKQMSDVTMLNHLIDTAHATVDEIEDHLSRTEILLSLSDLHKWKNDEDRAINALRGAAAAASMIEDPERNLEALLRCGTAQLSLGDIDGARQTGDDISFASEYVDWSLSGATYELSRQKMRFLVHQGEPLGVIKTLHFGAEDIHSRVMHLASAVQILVEAGRNEDGTSLLAELIDCIEEIDSSFVGTFSDEIISAALACGRVDDAIKSAERMEELTSSIEDPISGICKIVEFMSETGNQKGATEYLASIIDKILMLPSSERFWPYECVAKTQRTIGDAAGEQETLRILAALLRDDERANESSGFAANDIEARMAIALSTQDWSSADKLLATVKDMSDRIRLIVSMFSKD